MRVSFLVFVKTLKLLTSGTFDMSAMVKLATSLMASSHYSPALCCYKTSGESFVVSASPGHSPQIRASNEGP